MKTCDSIRKMTGESMSISGILRLKTEQNEGTLIQCAENEMLTPFPSVTRGKRTEKTPLLNIYIIDCICD